MIGDGVAQRNRATLSVPNRRIARLLLSDTKRRVLGRKFAGIYRGRPAALQKNKNAQAKMRREVGKEKWQVR